MSATSSAGLVKRPADQAGAAVVLGLALVLPLMAGLGAAGFSFRVLPFGSFGSRSSGPGTLLMSVGETVA